MPSRRNVLIGLGGIVVGGGALMSTGAFTTVEAERTVNVETATDENAILGLAVENADYASETDGTLQIDLDGSSSTNADGINQNATSTFDDIFSVANNGSDPVTTLTFEFGVDNAGGEESAVEEALSIRVAGSTYGDGDTGATNDITDEITMGDSDEDALNVGETLSIGLRVNLTDSTSDNDIPDSADITMTITADTS